MPDPSSQFPDSGLIPTLHKKEKRGKRRETELFNSEKNHPRANAPKSSRSRGGIQKREKKKEKKKSCFDFNVNASVWYSVLLSRRLLPATVNPATGDRQQEHGRTDSLHKPESYVAGGELQR